MPRASRSKGLAALLASLTATILAIPTAAEPPSGASPPPLEAFASLPATRDVTLSPGGKMIAWLDSSAGDPRVVMFDVAAKKIVHVLALEAGMIFRQLHWNDDSTLLYELSMSVVTPSRRGPHRDPDIQREIYRIYATDVSNPTPRLMLKSDLELAFMTGVTVLKWRTSKPHSMIIQTYNWSRASLGDFDALRGRTGWVRSVYEVDTHTGNGTRLDMGDPYTIDYAVDADGKLLARDRWSPDTQMYSVVAKRGGTWTRIYAEKRRDPLEMLGPTADATAVWLFGADTDGRVKLWSQPLDGSPRKVAIEDPKSDVNRVLVDDTGALQAIWMVSSGDNPIWLDKAEQQRRAAMLKPFPGLRVDFLSHSDDKQLQILSTSGAASAPIFYLVDLKSHAASIVGSEYPALDGVKLGKVVSFNYKAHDGTDIPGYLTLPPESSSAALPLVVLPHGGPAERDHDNMTFEWLRQYLATRGYAVFQPQFRGSREFGEAFERAGDHQWGLLMQDDITDGVHALIDKGQADPHRICIVGYSFGSGYAGYAALAGAAFTPDLYQCVVSVNGISDLPTFLDFEIQRDGSDSDSVAYWHTHFGERGDPNVIDRSPARAIDRFKAPVLLIYSAHDSIVPTNQSTRLADALRSQAKRVQLVELPEEDHDLSHTLTRVKALEVLTKFLQEHLQRAP